MTIEEFTTEIIVPFWSGLKTLLIGAACLFVLFKTLIWLMDNYETQTIIAFVSFGVLCLCWLIGKMFEELW